MTQDEAIVGRHVVDDFGAKGRIVGKVLTDPTRVFVQWSAEVAPDCPTERALVSRLSPDRAADVRHAHDIADAMKSA